MLNIAVFVSGRGSNLRAIHTAIEDGRLQASITLVVTSRDRAGAAEWAEAEGIPVLSVHHVQPSEVAKVLLEALGQHQANFIALAGFLKLIPSEVVAAFRNRILNVHPALLPAFGGTGMYGHHVHEAVIASGAKVSGATVHLVDEEYDRGPIVAQRCVPVQDDDTADDLAARVLEIEHSIFPEALELFAQNRIFVRDRRVFVIK
ncbi:MAG: phosphoribosylglycinamide formyltransferase [Ignavibacteria bacterium]|nr:MAG: phosphoribosylglycinamide formyltransferase [Ignavibacteria bacterium]